MKSIIFVLILVWLVGCKTGENANQAIELVDEIAYSGSLEPWQMSDNSRVSVDWAGVYTGFLPGADNPGIYVQIILNFDETYEVHYHYSGRSDDVFIFTGNFTWDNEGGTITLDNDRIPSHFRVGENRLFQLDMEGNMITGDLADMYILTKVGEIE
jgi:uncharacterized lipoprotein NlpE involved in copper resistance